MPKREGVMLIVTVEKLPHGRSEGREDLGQARIINVGGDSAYGAYKIEVLDHKGEAIGRGEITEYPRFATRVWDLVIRGVAMALCGTEQLPQRPLLSRQQ